MMKLTLSFALLLAIADSALAQTLRTDEPGIEGRCVAETIFTSMDQPGRGHVTMGEVEWFRDSAFAVMDCDDDGQVTYAEFATWDPGFGLWKNWAVRSPMSPHPRSSSPSGMATATGA